MSPIPRAVTSFRPRIAAGGVELTGNAFARRKSFQPTPHCGAEGG